MYYPNTTAKNCLPCYIGCDFSCTGPSSNQCKDCAADYIKKTTGSNFVCSYHICDQSCLNDICTGPGTQADCDACKTDYFTSFNPT